MTSESGLWGIAPNPAPPFSAMELVLSRPAWGFALDPPASDIVRYRGGSAFVLG